MTQTGKGRVLDQQDDGAGVESDRIRYSRRTGHGRCECDRSPGSFGRIHGWESNITPVRSREREYRNTGNLHHGSDRKILTGATAGCRVSFRNQGFRLNWQDGPDSAKRTGHRGFHGEMSILAEAKNGRIDESAPHREIREQKNDRDLPGGFRVPSFRVQSTHVFPGFRQPLTANRITRRHVFFPSHQ